MTLEEEVGSLLRSSGRSLAVAESCTGGLIGHRITNVAGSSAYFLLGVVSYSNEAKQGVLGVREETLASHGAVSTQTAEEMALGVRRLAGTDVAISTTGIAGPGGGSAEKPVGSVCVGLAWEGGVWSERFELGRDRDRAEIKQATADLALRRLLAWLEE
ncbi:MAG TPA: nicotinamide-nucleotide amidohydrolase family protein [Longimicrobiaceae bacterium]|nr:nicotinamide-nucleotide amidohydrolase family protein [Longimicrobiaceae bacterium]